MHLQFVRTVVSSAVVFAFLGAGVASLAQSSSEDLVAGYHEYYAGNLRDAARIAEQCVRANPRIAEARILLARIQMVTGQVPRAYQELQRALRTSPGNIDVLYYMGLVSNIMAQGEYLQLYKMAPDSGRAHQLQGEMYHLQQNRAKALEEYEAAVKASPELLEVWLAMGDLERSDLNFEKAAADYKKALEIQSSNYDALYGLGACSQQEEPEKAIEFFTRAVQVAPEQTESRVALGDVLLKTNQPAEAIKQLQAAVQLNPKLRQAYILLGRAQQALGQDALAEQSFRKARDIVQIELDTRRNRVRKGLQISEPQAKENPSPGTGESQK